MLLFENIWHVKTFRNARLGKLALQACNAFHSQTWRAQLRLVYDVTAEAYEIRRWGCSCKCHEEQRERPGYTEPCVEQGKRLPEVPVRIMAFRDSVQAAASQAREGQQCADEPLPHDLELLRIHCFSRLHAHSINGFEYLAHLPYSLAYVETTEDLEEELLIYVDLPPARRHRVAEYFFAPGPGTLRADGDISIRQGFFTARAANELWAIRQSPFAEEKGEAPHSVMARERRRCPAARRPWCAANARFRESVAFYKKLFPEHKEMFNREWNRWKRILQFRRKRPFTPVKCRARQVFERAYTSFGFQYDYTGVPAAAAWGADTKTAASNIAKAQAEYMKAVVKENTVFTIGAEKDTMIIFDVLLADVGNKKTVRSAKEDVQGLLISFLPRYNVHDPTHAWPAGGVLPDQFDAVPTEQPKETIILAPLCPLL